MNTNKKYKKKISNVLLTKISIEDYIAFLILTKIYYEAGLIKEESSSEILSIYSSNLLDTKLSTTRLSALSRS